MRNMLRNLNTSANRKNALPKGNIVHNRPKQTLSDTEVEVSMTRTKPDELHQAIVLLYCDGLLFLFPFL